MMKRIIFFTIALSLLFVHLSVAQTVVNPIDVGKPVEGEIGINTQSIWTFVGQGGDMISIEAESDDFDIRVELLDSQGNVVIFDEDSGKKSNALIRDFALPASDTYSILIEAANLGNGRFKLLLLSSSYVDCSKYDELVFETVDFASALHLERVEQFEDFFWRLPNSWQGQYASNRSQGALPALGEIGRYPGTVVLSQLYRDRFQDLDTPFECGMRQWLYEAIDAERANFQMYPNAKIVQDRFVQLGDHEGALLVTSRDAANHLAFLNLIIGDSLVTIVAEFEIWGTNENSHILQWDWITPLLAMASTITNKSEPPVLAGQTLEDSFASDKRVTFREDFDANTVGWEEAREERLNSEIIDGVYRLTFLLGPEDIYWVVAPGFSDWSAAPVMISPYELQFEVFNLFSESPDYSVVVLFDVNPGYLPYKRLLIRRDWTWRLLRWTGKRELLGEGQLQGEPINFEDGRTHQITLRVDEEHYTLLIDGKEQLVIPNTDPVQGTVGFGLDGGNGTQGQVYAEFDNLIIRNID